MSTNGNADEIYPVAGGRVRTRSLEVHVVDHCNLHCAQCCSLSPFLPKWCIEPAALERDLRLAKRVLTPTWLKLVGGEPLLHPHIDECLAVARASGVGEIVSLTTNGLLLPRTSVRFWDLVQALTVSLYPQPALPAETIAWVERMAAERDVRLNWKRQDRFVQMDRDSPRADNERTREIYNGCWLRQRCHIVSHGRFYTCTRPPHFRTLLGDEFLDDGLALDEEGTSAQRLLAYLLAERPLKACTRCEGGDGAVEPHRQMGSAELRARRSAWRQ